MDEYNTALAAYNQQWQALCAGRKNTAFFARLHPTALGWKTEDKAEYDRRLAALHDGAAQIIETWMNGRWIAKVCLRDTKLANGVQIIKIMQQRPGSADAVGLDHVDFYMPSELAEAKDVLTAETDLKWSQESNDAIAGYDWLSVWFDGTEAKLKHDTVLDIVAAELHQLGQKLVSAA